MSDKPRGRKPRRVPRWVVEGALAMAIADVRTGHADLRLGGRRFLAARLSMPCTCSPVSPLCACRAPWPPSPKKAATVETRPQNAPRRRASTAHDSCCWALKIIVGHHLPGIFHHGCCFAGSVRSERSNVCQSQFGFAQNSSRPQHPCLGRLGTLCSPPRPRGPGLLRSFAHASPSRCRGRRPDETSGLIQPIP